MAVIDWATFTLDEWDDAGLSQWDTLLLDPDAGYSVIVEAVGFFAPCAVVDLFSMTIAQDAFQPAPVVAGAFGLTEASQGFAPGKHAADCV